MRIMLTDKRRFNYVVLALLAAAIALAASRFLTSAEILAR
jgi:hypothetical protein